MNAIAFDTEAEFVQENLATKQDILEVKRDILEVKRDIPAASAPRSQSRPERSSQTHIQAAYRYDSSTHRTGERLPRSGPEP